MHACCKWSSADRMNGAGACTRVSTEGIGRREGGARAAYLVFGRSARVQPALILRLLLPIVPSRPYLSVFTKDIGVSGWVTRTNHLRSLDRSEYVISFGESSFRGYKVFRLGKFPPIRESWHALLLALEGQALAGANLCVVSLLRDSVSPYKVKVIATGCQRCRTRYVRSRVPQDAFSRGCRLSDASSVSCTASGSGGPCSFALDEVNGGPSMSIGDFSVSYCSNRTRSGPF